MNLKLMKQLCGTRKDKLEKILIKYLHSVGYKKVKHTNMYIMAEGELPICLIAHMDTVFHYLPDDFFYDSQRQVLWCPGGSGFDDRAGIYAILQILEAGYKPHIIFTDKEEVGGLGAQAVAAKFPDCPFEDCRALIQLDRANKEDAVYYDCDNPDFEKYIGEFGFKLDWGTFSDISILAPKWGIAAVNLSIGYEDEHTGNERLHCDWCDTTIKRVKKILNKSKDMKAYAYIPYNYIYKRHYGTIYNDFNYDWYNAADVSGLSPIEEDALDDGRFERCLLCGNHLDPDNAHYIPDPEFPYAVCNKCFNLYYDADSVEQGMQGFGQIMPLENDKK